MFNTKKISIKIEIFFDYIIKICFNYAFADVTTLSIKPYSQASAADK